MRLPRRNIRGEPPHYRHAEAFAVLTYEADDGTEREQIWNSRDGVTPFVITLRSGKRATHVRWDEDQRMPEDWTPPPGMRRFTDLTRPRAREMAAVMVDRWLADPELHDRLFDKWPDRDQAITELAESALSQPGAPDLLDPQAEAAAEAP